MAVAYAFSDTSQKQRSCGVSSPICLGTEMIILSFLLWFFAMFQCPQFPTDHPILFPGSTNFEEKVSSSR